jgi:CPA2 family monovalent cation:H+ antiporter-2
MFSLGLEFSFRKLARVGLTSSITAVIEMSLMMLVGYTLGGLLGWKSMDRIFLAAMMAISSTTIIVKALRELKLSSRRFAEIVFGVLIVEDLGAVLILVALSSIAVSQTISGIALLAAAGKLLLIAGSWFIAGYFVVPRFVRWVGKRGNEETLTVVSLGLCLSLVAVADYFGYSAALGAFIMGSILAETSEVGRIEKQIEPLRDLFVAVFFVSVGMQLDFRTLSNHGGELAIITGALMFGKLFAATTGALVSGQRLGTAMQVGFSLGQIGEFSFIIGGLGISLGVLSKDVFSIIVVVSIITTFTTPYLIRLAGPLALKAEARLPERLIAVLDRYAGWITERENDVANRRDFFRALMIWTINGILVSVTFVLVRQLTQRDDFSELLGWGIALVASMPFIWGMLGSFARLSQGGTLVWSRLFAITWIGLLSTQFFPLRFAIAITLGGVTLFSIIFYRRLEASYRWFESEFSSAFVTSPHTHDHQELHRLAPWDAHLVRLRVHPNSEIVTFSIGESQLRSRYGVNVVVIQRGNRSIVAPNPSERILPDDGLLVLATDEQIEAVRTLIELPSVHLGPMKALSTTEDFDLRGIRVGAETYFDGRSIRDAGIRERFGAIVVGIERSGKRILGPESTLTLETGDLLWLVGEKDALDRLSLAAVGLGSGTDSSSGRGAGFAP